MYVPLTFLLTDEGNFFVLGMKFTTEKKVKSPGESFYLISGYNRSLNQFLNREVKIDDKFLTDVSITADSYNRKIIVIISKAGTKRNIDIHKGIYCGVKGPQMETPAEQKMIRMLGADLVGMSTVPEIITGIQLGLICAGLSIVTNTCSPDNPEVTTVEEVVLNAGLVDDHLAAILVDTIVELES